MFLGGGGQSGLGVTLSTRLYVVPRLKIVAATLPVPMCLHGVYRDNFDFNFNLTFLGMRLKDRRYTA
jgi:hypothetical protein